MSKVYALASIRNQGKTSTSIALEQYFRKQGQKVACLQKIKGQYDGEQYLKNGCYHYSIPLEVAQNRDAFERWLPKGFDVYIIEVSMPFSPIGSAYLNLFQTYNEVISADVKNSWDEYVRNYLLTYYQDPNIVTFFEKAHEKRFHEVITKVQDPLDTPCVDTGFVLHHPEELVSDSFEPKMVLPRSEKKVIAVGGFPAEFMDIFPNLKWFGYDYGAFITAIKQETYDLAVIGECINYALKLTQKPVDQPTICYQPSLYRDVRKKQTKKGSDRLPDGDLLSVYEKVRKTSVDSPLGDKGTHYESYNNRFRTSQTYCGNDIITKDKNFVYCNGWILPQYLIREGLLEV